MALESGSDYFRAGVKLGNWRRWRNGAQLVADVSWMGKTGAEHRWMGEDREKAPWFWPGHP